MSLIAIVLDVELAPSRGGRAAVLRRPPREAARGRAAAPAAGAGRPDDRRGRPGAADGRRLRGAVRGTRRASSSRPLGSSWSRAETRLAVWCWPIAGMLGSSSARCRGRTRARSRCPPRRRPRCRRMWSSSPSSAREAARSSYSTCSPRPSLETATSCPKASARATMARIDALDPADAALVRRAAVLGLSFQPDRLEDVLEAGTPVPDERFWDRMSVVFAREPDGHVRFRRPALQEVAYSSLPFKLRRELHLAVGLRLEREQTGDHDANAAVLSNHFALAGDHARAQRYALIAAESGEREVRPRRRGASLPASDRCGAGVAVRDRRSGAGRRMGADGRRAAMRGRAGGGKPGLDRGAAPAAR